MGRRSAALGPLDDLRWTLGIVALAAVLAACHALVSYQLSPFALPLVMIGAAAAVVAVTRPAWGIVLALLAVALELVTLKVATGNLTPAEALLALVALGWLGRALMRSEGTVQPSLRDAPIIVLLILTALGLLVAVDREPVWRVLVLWTLFYFLYLQVQSFSDQELRRIVWAFVIGTGVLGGIGAGQFLAAGGADLHAGGAIAEGRATGTFFDPNYFAAILLLGILPGLALIASNAKREIGLLLFAGAGIAGVLFSLSRGAALGLGFGLLTLTLISRHARWAFVGVVTVVALLVVLGSGPIGGSGAYSQIDARLSTISVDQLGTSVNRRPDAWQTAISLAAQNPLVGVGSGQFQYGAALEGVTERRRPIENAHNTPLNIAAENGIIGLLAFLALVIQWFAFGRRALRTRDPLRRALASGLVAGLAGFLLQSLTIVPLRVTVTAAAFFVVGGMLATLARRARAEASTAPGSAVQPVATGAVGRAH